MIKSWSNVDPDISACNLRDFIRGWHVTDIVGLLACAEKSPLIVVANGVRENIMSHLCSRPIEQGGLLLGSVISAVDLNVGVVAIQIDAAVESREFDATSVSLSMSSAVWQEANEMSTSKKFVVGWYHSHPNLGAFFSGTDRKTQRDTFNNFYSLGLVIDPIRCEERWFIGPQSEEVGSGSVVESFKI